jgi:hypothetical protein
MKVKFFSESFVSYIFHHGFVVAGGNKYKLLYTPKGHEVFGRTIIAIDKVPKCK